MDRRRRRLRRLDTRGNQGRARARSRRSSGQRIALVARQGGCRPREGHRCARSLDPVPSYSRTVPCKRAMCVAQSHCCLQRRRPTRVSSRCSASDPDDAAHVRSLGTACTADCRYRQRWEVPEDGPLLGTLPAVGKSSRSLIARRSISNWSVCAGSLLNRARLVHRRWSSHHSSTRSFQAWPPSRCGGLRIT